MAGRPLFRLSAVCSLVLCAQADAQLSKWPLRTGSGEIRLIDFNAPEPLVGSLIPSFGLGGSEDVNLMTDPAGEALFVTAVDAEGKISVRRPSGALVANGTGLQGNSSSQASAIAPRPCHAGQYYIIHHDADAHRHYYSIVDMNLNGGNGAVIEKNILLANYVGEGLAISRQLHGGCRWLLSFRVEDGSYRILRARITALGIGEWAEIGSCALGGDPKWWSTLKLSPANDRLALSMPGNAPASAPDAVLWDLDLEAGSLQGMHQVALSQSAICGLEFSPAGQYLYFVGNSDVMNVDFGRMRLATQAVEIIDPAIGWWLVSMECAGNGRLYVGARGLSTTTLAEVRYPDAATLAEAAYNHDAISFFGWGMIPSLPNSIEGEPPGSAPPPIHADFNVFALPGCEGHRFVPTSCLATAWEWDFGDGWGTDIAEPVHHYPVGTFTVGLRVTACGQSFEVIKPDHITIEGIQPIASFQHPDTACQRAVVGFENTSELATGATWFFGDGSSTDTYEPAYAYPAHGTRTVTLVARNGCIMDTARSVIEVLPAGLPSFHTNSDPCDERTYFVNTTEGGETYIWDFGDGDTTSTWYHPVHIFQSEGAFEVRLTTEPGERCENTFTRTLHAGYGIFPVAWFIPNAFTPNNDGTNDVLRIEGPGPCQSPVMSIHNKWGQLVWEGDADTGWDGSYGGMPAPEGVYAYIMRPRLGDAKHGWVVLAR